MPGQSDGVNDLMRRCVVSVMKRLGSGEKNLSKAFEICKAGLHKSGRTTEKGTLTGKGRNVLVKKKRDPDHKKKLDAYEELLKKNREE